MSVSSEWKIFFKEAIKGKGMSKNRWFNYRITTIDLQADLVIDIVLHLMEPNIEKSFLQKLFSLTSKSEMGRRYILQIPTDRITANDACQALWY